MPHDAYRSLYIHIPFCRSKCAYCDFHSRAVKPNSKWVDNYVEHVVSEVRRLSKEGELAGIETVYVGGGTPTHIGTKALSSILYALGVSMALTKEVECTIEANPESLDERLVADIWALGANRISIGVQSFDDALLARLDRPHSADDARRAVKTAQARFDNLSIDLMCGLPGQTLRQFEESLDEATELGARHVSIYPLTIENGTKFERLMRKGKLEIPDDDLVADMMELASRKLADAGLARYEVSNYAQPGYESRHNASYWKSLPYLGIGESAVTMTQNAERRMRVMDGNVIEDLNPVQMAAEDLMLAMRMSKGVSDAILEAKKQILPRALDVFDELEELGLVSHQDGRWRPTDRGWICGNELYGTILDLGD